MKRGCILLLVLLFTVSPLLLTTPTIDNDSNSYFSIIAQEFDEAILIQNNTQFAAKGFAGEGTSESPYLIQNLVIQATSLTAFYDCAILMQNTDAYFIIRNCTCFSSYSTGQDIRFSNVTNGRIENCTITSGEGPVYTESSYGVYLQRSSNIEITDCTITGFAYGVQCSSCQTCLINSTSFSNQNYMAIHISNSNHTSITNIVARGSGLGRPYWGIYVVATSLNCSIYSNILINYTLSAIRLQLTRNCTISSNNVSFSGTGILIQDTNESRVTQNVLIQNDDGIFVDTYSENNSITNNILGYNENNAFDRGKNNSWYSNWYSDYGGVGLYYIPGSAGSVDISPQPQSLHLPNLTTWMMAALVLSMIAFSYGIIRYMKGKDGEEDKLARIPLVLVLILSILLPCGISLLPGPSEALPNLRYMLIDIIGVLGFSRVAGGEWTSNIISVSIVTQNSTAVYALLAYLATGIITIIFFILYIRKNLGKSSLIWGIILVTIIAAGVSLGQSIIMIPFTPLLTLLILFWMWKIKSTNEAKID